MENAGKILIVTGVILVIAGIIVYFFGNRFGWIGHLPGDIRVERENFRFYFPITTMIILSVILSLVVWLIKKL